MVHDAIIGWSTPRWGFLDAMGLVCQKLRSAPDSDEVNEAFRLGKKIWHRGFRRMFFFNVFFCEIPCCSVDTLYIYRYTECIYIYMKLLCEFVYTYVNVHQEIVQRSFFESLMDQLSEGPNRQSAVQGDSIIKTLPTVDAFWSFFSGRTGNFIKKNHPKREIVFCFAHGNGITFFDRNKRTNKQTSTWNTYGVLNEW